MKKILYISTFLLLFPLFLFGQDSIPPVRTDTLSTKYTPVNDMDTTKSINYWRITERTGERVAGQPDTTLTDYFNRTLVDGQSVSMAYLGNLGLPMESRIFFERPDRSNFIFLDPYYNYSKTPDRFDFINTKIPYSNLTYQSAGSQENKEERLQGALSINFGKNLNLGFDVDYLYARGFYNSQSSKHLDWVFYGTYLADRHHLHAFINPMNYTNGENGGIMDDNYISHPDYFDNVNIQTKDIPVQFQETWNHLKGSRYYVNYHYNLGYERDTEKTGDSIRQFIPVSSIIYTFDYVDRKRNFYTNDSLNLDAFYDNRDFLKTKKAANDSTSYWSLKNTLGLSLREGFSPWAKFDLTAFLTQEMRSYEVMDTVRRQKEENQSSTYIGGEIAKRTGTFFQYEAQGSVGILGDNLGDLDISGNIKTRIPVFRDTASLTASAYIKNTAPTYYENHYQSKYFWWNEDFNNVNKVFFGGNLDIPHTKTNLSLGVENLTNYIYFNETGFPEQHTGSIQILAATLKQNLKLGALHWNNQLVYQQSGDQDIIPLPDLSLYSSLFIQFKIAKVLTMQLGGNLHYFSKYYSPTYEPATQQFRLQKEIEIGEYPLISGFINCHLKYTRFFVEFYNLSSSFISPPEYFSLPHYPLNPQIFKLGLAIDFRN